jgi:hypothetical protein
VEALEEDGATYRSPAGRGVAGVAWAWADGCGKVTRAGTGFNSSTLDVGGRKREPARTKRAAPPRTTRNAVMQLSTLTA